MNCRFLFRATSLFVLMALCAVSIAQPGGPPGGGGGGDPVGGGGAGAPLDGGALMLLVAGIGYTAYRKWWKKDIHKG